MATATKTILILGASYGGLSVAHYTLKHVITKIPSDVGIFQVILISPSSQVFCRPTCHLAMISEDTFPPEQLFVDIQDKFQNNASRKFQFIQGKAMNLDYKSRFAIVQSLDGATEKIGFHAVIVATGASTASPFLGLTQNEHLFRNPWDSFRKALPESRTIVIAGGGPAGIEAAGELGEYLNGRAGLLSSTAVQPKATITVVTSGEDILPRLRPSQKG